MGQQDPCVTSAESDCIRGLPADKLDTDLADTGSKCRIGPAEQVPFSFFMTGLREETTEALHLPGMDGMFAAVLTWNDA